MAKKKKCEICNKEFESDDALDSHNSAKHKIKLDGPNKEKFKIKKRYIILAGILILLGLLAYTLYKNQSSPGEYDNFAKCLTEKGAVMYGTEWCGFCKKQKELFGNSFKEINFVDCDKDRGECLANGVTGYPTWIINGEKYSGFQSLERLSELSGCEINSFI